MASMCNRGASATVSVLNIRWSISSYSTCADGNWPYTSISALKSCENRSRPYLSARPVSSDFTCSIQRMLSCLLRTNLSIKHNTSWTSLNSSFDVDAVTRFPTNTNNGFSILKGISSVRFSIEYFTCWKKESKQPIKYKWRWLSSIPALRL